MTTRRPTLDAPVIVDRFWKNRRKDAVVVTLSTFQGQDICDLRTHYMDKTGRLQPTPKGLCIVVRRLPDLAVAVNKAMAKARELNLIGDHDGHEDEEAASE
jgi:hypothetical protein